jgi:ferredoxin
MRTGVRPGSVAIRPRVLFAGIGRTILRRAPETHGIIGDERKNGAARATMENVMTTRKIIEIDEALCDGCGQCIISCAEGALEIREGKARVIADRYCDGLGACLGHCPTGALRIIEREADPFDEEAVEELLRTRSHTAEEQPAVVGCPSAMVGTLEQRATPCQEGGSRRSGHGGALRSWPVQISLVPPNAPFLKGADLLVAADCAPPACPSFHEQFLPGRVLLLGCPKLDDQQAYLERFVQIFRQNEIRTVTVLVMEVPCCQSLPRLIERAARLAGAEVEVRTAIIGRDGEVKDRPLGRQIQRIDAPAVR